MNGMRWFALLLVALALTACGSSDEGPSEAPSEGPSDAPSGSSEKLSKAELISKADKICEDSRNRLKAIPPPTSVKDYAGAERYGEKVASLLEEGVGKFKDLTPPDSVRSDYAAFVKEGEDQVEASRQLADAGKAKNADEIVAAQRLLKSDAPRRLARRIGFKVCGVAS